MKRLLLTSMLLTVACIAQAQSATPLASIDAGKEGAPISPCLYGQFLEHGGSIMYGGLWSEMIEERKFC